MYFSENVKNLPCQQGWNFCFFGSEPRVHSFFWLPKRVNRDISCIATKVRKLQIYPQIGSHNKLPLPVQLQDFPWLLLSLSSSWFRGSFIPFSSHGSFLPLFWLTNLRSLGAKKLSLLLFLLIYVVRKPKVNKSWEPKKKVCCARLTIWKRGGKTNFWSRCSLRWVHYWRWKHCRYNHSILLTLHNKLFFLAPKIH